MQLFVLQIKVKLGEKVSKAVFIQMRKEHGKHVAGIRTDRHIQVSPRIAQLYLTQGFLPLSAPSALAVGSGAVAHLIGEINMFFKGLP